MAYGGRTYTINDENGNAIVGVYVSVFPIGEEERGTIYSTNAGAALANPFQSAALGVAEFFAVAGFYDVKLQKAGYMDQWIRGIQVIDNALDAETLELSTADYTTAGDIIKSALRKIRAYKPGESISDAEITDNLDVLNTMLDAWSSEGLMIFSTVKESFALTTDQPDYTIGYNADFNTDVPEKLDHRSCYIRDSNSIDYMLQEMSEREYNSITPKTNISGIPYRIFLKPTHPIGRIYIDSPPIAGMTLFLVSQKALAQFADATIQVDLPSGYRRAMIYNLAIELAPEYGKQTSAEVAKIAAMSKSNIESVNSKAIEISVSGTLGRSNSYSKRDFMGGK